MKRKLLEILRYVSSREGEPCRNMESIADLSCYSVSFVRIVMKHLHMNGLVRKTYLVDDDGMLCGSGYVRTLSGDRAIAKEFGE